MPHPERASEAILGCADGLLIFQSLVHALDSASELKAAPPRHAAPPVEVVAA